MTPGVRRRRLTRASTTLRSSTLPPADLIHGLHDVVEVCDAALHRGYLGRTTRAVAMRAGQRTVSDPLPHMRIAVERAVLALMAEGLFNTGVATRLHVGVRTVETYINAVFTKLALHTDADEHRRVRALLAYLNASGTRP